MADNNLLEELKSIKDITDDSKISELLGRLEGSGLSAEEIAGYRKSLIKRRGELKNGGQKESGGFETVSDWTKLTEEQAAEKSKFLEDNVTKENIAELAEIKEMKEFLGEEFSEEADILTEYLVHDTRLDAFTAPGPICKKEALSATIKEKAQIASAELANVIWQNHCDNKLVDLNSQLLDAQEKNDSEKVKKLEEEIKKVEQEMMEPRTLAQLKEAGINCSDLGAYLGLKANDLKKKADNVAKKFPAIGIVKDALSGIKDWDERMQKKSKLYTIGRGVLLNQGGLLAANILLPGGGTAIWAAAKGIYQTKEMVLAYRKAKVEARKEFSELGTKLRQEKDEAKRKEILKKMEAQRDIYSSGFGTYLKNNKEKAIGATMSFASAVIGGAAYAGELAGMEQKIARAATAFLGGTALAGVEIQKAAEARKAMKAAQTPEEAAKFEKEMKAHIKQAGIKLVTGGVSAAVGMYLGDFIRDHGQDILEKTHLAGVYATVSNWFHSSSGATNNNTNVAGDKNFSLFNNGQQQAEEMWNAKHFQGSVGAGVDDDVTVPFKPGMPEYITDTKTHSLFDEFARKDPRDFSAYLHKNGLLSPENEAYYKAHGVLPESRIDAMIAKGEIPQEHVDGLKQVWAEKKPDIDKFYEDKLRALREQKSQLDNVDGGGKSEIPGEGEDSLDDASHDDGTPDDTTHDELGEEKGGKKSKFSESQFDNYDNSVDSNASVMKRALAGKPINFNGEAFDYEGKQLNDRLNILAKDNNIPLGQRRAFVETALAAKEHGLQMSVGVGENGKPQFYVFDENHTSAACMSGVRAGKVDDFVKNFAENGNGDNSQYIDKLQERFCERAHEVTDLQDDDIWNHKDGKLLRDNLKLVAEKNQIPAGQRDMFVAAAIVAKDNDLKVSLIRDGEGGCEFFISDKDGNLITSLNDENVSGLDKEVQRLAGIGGKADLKNLSNNLASEGRSAAAAGSSPAPTDPTPTDPTTLEGSESADLTDTGTHGVDLAANEMSKAEFGGTQHRFSDGSAYKIGEDGTYHIIGKGSVSVEDKAAMSSLYLQDGKQLVSTNVMEVEVTKERVYRDLLNRQNAHETLSDGEKLFMEDRDYELNSKNIIRNEDGTLRKMTQEEITAWRKTHTGSIFDSPVFKRAQSKLHD